MIGTTSHGVLRFDFISLWTREMEIDRITSISISLFERSSKISGLALMSNNIFSNDFHHMQRCWFCNLTFTSTFPIRLLYFKFHNIFNYLFFLTDSKISLPYAREGTSSCWRHKIFRYFCNLDGNRVVRIDCYHKVAFDLREWRWFCMRMKRRDG